GSLFDSLQRESLLHDFAVDPMASDLHSWEEQDYDLFARLLRVRRDQVLTHRFPLKERGRYFFEINHKGDIFLDPDTGVATNRVARPEQYVLLRDVWSLFGNGLNRLIAVYQHVRGRKCATRVDEVVQHLCSTSVSPSWCSYESGTVAMLFLSLAPHRTAAIAAAFRRELGRHAGGRIRGSSHS
ncbi:MAG: hypothetical protein ACREA0_32030, partial [bacterium]